MNKIFQYTKTEGQGWLVEKPEIWKVVEGYEGKYEISSLGNVRTLARRVERGKRGFNHIKTKILRQSPKFGYMDVRLYKNRVGKTIRVHRLVALAFIPNPENKRCINHKNGIKHDNRVENLEWCTHKENYDHARSVLNVSSGRSGERNGLSKLKEYQVMELYEHIKNGGSTKSFAEKMGVLNQTIIDITKGRSWKNVELNWGLITNKRKRFGIEIK